MNMYISILLIIVLIIQMIWCIFGFVDSIISAKRWKKYLKSLEEEYEYLVKERETLEKLCCKEEEK